MNNASFRLVQKSRNIKYNEEFSFFIFLSSESFRKTCPLLDQSSICETHMPFAPSPPPHKKNSKQQI